MKIHFKSNDYYKKIFLPNYSQVNLSVLTEGYLNDNETITIYLPNKNIVNRR